MSAAAVGARPQDDQMLLSGTAQTSSAVIELVNAAVGVRGRRIWSGATLRVTSGQFVAVLGPNGAGKSTLLKAALGLHPLAEGQLKVLGQQPGTANARIGYLPQRRSFDPGVRVRGLDVVRLGLDGDRWGLPLPRRSSHAWRRVHELVELVDAAKFAHRPIGELSGGEQQRLLIAQALARQPRLLLLDEPLDSLDLPTQAAVAALIARISAEQVVAVLMVAHDVNPILPYLDQVLYLAHGHAAAGPPGQVITTETLSRLYRTPIEVLTTSDGRLVVVGQPEAPALHHSRHPHT
jgi:zinc/manganese transport system ATP-binding protein